MQEDIIEDPDNEFDTDLDPKHADGPRVINVGIPGPGAHVPLWKRAWRDKILPAVARFKPDIIFISAGFDAHRKDDINFRLESCRLLLVIISHLRIPHRGWACDPGWQGVCEIWNRPHHTKARQFSLATSLMEPALTSNGVMSYNGVLQILNGL